MQIAILLLILGVALVLFARETFSVDVTALGVMLALILTGLLTPQQAFDGFGSDVFIMLLGLLILTAALGRTGVIEWAGKIFYRLVGDRPKRLTAVTMTIAGGMSSFMSNLASTAFFLPLIVSMARKLGINPSKLLMPLAFSTILASSVTLIATSTNIVASGLMTRYGLEPLGIFELTPMGVPILFMGILYMTTIGVRLIPPRAPMDETQTDLIGRMFIAEVTIAPASPFANKSLGDTRMGDELDINVLRVLRDKQQQLTPTAGLVLLPGDELIVEGSREAIMNIKQITGLVIKADAKQPAHVVARDIGIIEAIILPGSPLIGRTLRGVRFREKYGLNVLAISHHGEAVQRQLKTIRMTLGDSLLIQGVRQAIEVLQKDATFAILDRDLAVQRPDLRRAPLAVGIFALVLLASMTGLIPLPVAALLGAVLVFITRCITPEEAYRQVEWKVLLLVGSMLSLGTAMQTTGTAEFLAEGIIGLIGASDPILLLTIFFWLTILLTQPLSNQAAAVVVLPIAIQTAISLNLDPRPFAIIATVAATGSFITPLEPACVLIFGPGHYKFLDFARVGAPLLGIIFFISIVLVPAIWPPVVLP